jgi:hypothetical protein
MAENTLRDLDEGDHVHSETTGEVYEIEELDVEFHEDEYPDGTVTFRDGESTFTQSAEDVFHDLQENTLAVVDEQIIENAEGILMEFAEQEIESYLQRLGVNHDYNGIDSVDTFRDLKAAVSLLDEGGE